MLQHRKRDGGYTLLLVLLITTVLLLTVFSLIEVSNYSMKVTKSSQQASKLQYSTDNLARTGYMLVVDALQSVTEGTWPPTGMSMNVPLTITDDTQFIKSTILQQVNGSEEVTVGDTTATGEYYIKWLPDKDQPAPDSEYPRTYYLQAVGQVGSKTSVINFAVTIATESTNLPPVNTYPYDDYSDSYVFDSSATTQSEIDAAMANYDGTSGLVFCLANPSDPSTPGDLIINKGSLEYGGADTPFQALIAGNVIPNSNTSLDVHGDLIAENVTLNSNSSLAVDGNLVTKTLVVNSDTTLTVGGQLQCDSIQLNSGATVIVQGALSDQADLIIDSNSNLTIDGVLKVAGNVIINSGASLHVTDLMKVDGRLHIDSNSELQVAAGLKVAAGLDMNTNSALKVDKNLCDGGDFTEGTKSTAVVGGQATILGNVTIRGNAKFRYGSFLNTGPCPNDEQLILVGLYQL